MFTGLVEELGVVDHREGGRFRFEARRVVDALSTGDSIAVNGVCLTVVAHGDGWWEAEAVDETLSRSALGDLAAGDAVNLERPLRADGRLGGHLVQGHVDGVGVVAAPAPALAVTVPAHLARYLVPKGSVAVDGCSLTVAALTADGFEVAVIPHTAAVTTLGRRQPGDRVNLEVDVLAKYVERLAEPYRTGGAQS